MGWKEKCILYRNHEGTRLRGKTRVEKKGTQRQMCGLEELKFESSQGGGDVLASTPRHPHHSDR